MTLYYAKSTESYTIALMDMFNGLQCNRYTSAGNIDQTINVPIGFGPVDKAFVYRKELEMVGKPNYIMTVPRVAVSFNGMAFAADRAKSLNDERFWQYALNLTDENFKDYQPVPYDFYFTLWIRTEKMSDFSQITEQILPYFAPSRTLRVREFSWLNIERDIPVHMTAVNCDMESQLTLGEDVKRELNGSCTLTLQGWLYKPVTASKIIKHIDVKYLVAPDLVNPIQTLIDGYETSATIPTSGYSSSGVNASGHYYTITENE